VATLDPIEPRFARALAIGAHPDDAEFFAGGTLARLADAGVRVSLVVVTNGAQGGRDLVDPARVRAGEQERAAKIVPFHASTNLGRPDGSLVADEALRAELARILRRERPELVLTHDPHTFFRAQGGRAQLGHSDHRATAQAALDAIYPRAASPNFYPEQLADGVEPWYPRELWLFDTAAPTARVDVAATLERKLAALRAHESQNAGDGLVRAARAFGTEEPFVRLVLRRGRRDVDG
jgi:LmbE family N-acetylglucosaminyl deacetylase